MSRLSEDLRDRTKRFASDDIQLYVMLPKQRKEVEILGNQLLRSGTSVAAHAREASRARSDAEFCSKLDGLLKEAVADDESVFIAEPVGLGFRRLSIIDLAGDRQPMSD